MYFQSDASPDDAVVTVEDDGEDAVVSIDDKEVARIVGAAGQVMPEDFEFVQAEAAPEPPVQAEIVIDGTDDPDTLTGTVAAETINGLGGDDDIEGDGGADTISGGEGNDVIQGQAGFDEVTGDAGNDLIQGRGGSDSLSGGADNDWVDGNDNADTVDGGEGDDTVIGGLGADALTGGDDDDVLVAGEALADPLSTTALSAVRGGATLNDALSGVDIGATITLEDDGAVDTLDGGGGADSLFFGAGDTATGGSGADLFGVISGGDGSAIITDYDSAEDRVVILDPTFDTRETDPVVTVNDNGADAEILLDGVIVGVVVAGAGKISADDISVVSGVATNLIDPNAAAVI